MKGRSEPFTTKSFTGDAGGDRRLRISSPFEKVASPFMCMLLLWATSFLPLTKLIERNLLDLMQNRIMQMPVSIVYGLAKLCDQPVFARERERDHEP